MNIITKTSIGLAAIGLAASIAVALLPVQTQAATRCGTGDITIRETGYGIVHVMGSYDHPGRLYGITVYVRDAATGKLIGSNGGIGFQGGANFQSYVPVTHYADRYRIEIQCHAPR